MNDLATQQHSQFNASQEHSAIATELAKMLGLVAPVTMSADQQTLWLASAVESLQDIRANEVAGVSLEVRRSVTRPSQIVPRIAELAAERRREQRRVSQQISEEREARIALPAKRHIADRDRRDFGPSDWAELNEHLEKMGSPVRYGSDGKKLAA